MTFHRACNSVKTEKESGRSTATFQRWTYAMSRQAQGYMFLAFAMVLVGSTVVGSKFIAAALPPFTATALQFAIAFPILVVLMRATGTAWPKLTARDWGIVLLQAGAGSVGYTTLLISELRLTSATDAWSSEPFRSWPPRSRSSCSASVLIALRRLRRFRPCFSQLPAG